MQSGRHTGQICNCHSIYSIKEFLLTNVTLWHNFSIRRKKGECSFASQAVRTEYNGFSAFRLFERSEQCWKGSADLDVGEVQVFSSAPPCRSCCSGGRVSSAAHLLQLQNNSDKTSLDQICAHFETSRRCCRGQFLPEVCWWRRRATIHNVQVLSRANHKSLHSQYPRFSWPTPGTGSDWPKRQFFPLRFHSQHPELQLFRRSFCLTTIPWRSTIATTPMMSGFPYSNNS